MKWLLEVMDDHRAAVRYDLLKHGFRYEDVGTERLNWGDAVAILQQQPPNTSALYRDLFPDKYNRDLLVERLETIAVLLVRGQHLLGKQSDIPDEKLPNTWSELWAQQEAKPTAQLMTFSEIDARMGWDVSLAKDLQEIEKMTPEQIDERMGWR